MQKLWSQCRGTLVFDGWEDVNGIPVIHLLLLTESIHTSNSTIDFLKTVYPREKLNTSDLYISLIENALKYFKADENICAMTSCYASICRIVRHKYQDRHKSVAVINDQAHIADFLMDAVDKLPWVQYVIKKCQLNSTAPRFSNLKVSFSKYRRNWMKYSIVRQSLTTNPSLLDNKGSYIS